MTAIRVAINGYGRIGRNFLRALYEDRLKGVKRPIEVVAINDIGSPESLVHLTRYDTTHGIFQLPVVLDEYQLCVAGDAIPLTQFEHPELCPWSELDVDVVLECTGLYRSHADAMRHINAGAKRVIIGAVAFDEVDATIIYGVNQHTLSGDETIISSASCTTHCLAPLLSVLNDEWGVEQALMTEIHAYTSDQQLLDKTHRDLRRARSGAQNLIPTSSSSIGAIQKVLPFMAGRIDGYSMRVPTINVAAVDLTVDLGQKVPAEAINQAMRSATDNQFQGILAISEEPLVSSDFIHRPESAIFDTAETRSIGQMVKITAWYDNEWGYTHRLLDLLGCLSPTAQSQTTKESVKCQS